jgi:glycosyltransferase involved in cell wall biosynthesis
MQEALSVAVLVPTFRRAAALERCLAGLAAQTRRPDRVLVVTRPDDEAAHRVIDAAPAALTVERVSVGQPGQVAALNAGLDAFRDEVVAIIDDDCVPRPDWLERITARFAADPALDGLGGPDRLVQGGVRVTGERRRVGRVFWYGRFLGQHHLGAGAASEVDFLKGANMSYRRSAIAGQRFDPHLRGTGAQPHNDWAFSLGIRAAGRRLVFDPAIVVDHYEAARAKDNPRLAFDPLASDSYMYNQTYLAALYLRPARLRAHLVYSMLVGTKAAPGVVMTLYGFATRREPARDTLRRWTGARRARGAALRTAAQVRRT